jgi:hypothetical protein
MNALVLAIAGVLVLVGIALIALSVVLARKQAAPEEPSSASPAPPTGTGLAFIDQPLQTDMSAALGHSASPTGEAEPAESAEADPAEPARDEMTSLPQEDDDPTEETLVVGLQTQDETGGSTRPDKED